MLLDEIIELKQYMERHSERLTSDIKKANTNSDIKQEEFYNGSKQSTDMFIRLLQDVLDKE